MSIYEISRDSTGLIFRDQFDAADQNIDGYNSWEESSPGVYEIVSNLVEARKASTGGESMLRSLTDQGSVLIHTNLVRRGGVVAGEVVVNATSASDLGTSYRLNAKAGDGFRIARTGSGVLGSGGSVPAIDTLYAIRLVLDISPSPLELRAYINTDALSDLQDLTSDMEVVASATDATSRPTGGYYGIRCGDGSNAIDADYDEFFVCGRTIVVTGLASGQKIQVDSRSAVEESGGSVTIDVDAWALPATTIKVLDSDDNELDSLTPSGGIWGGDEYSVALAVNPTVDPDQPTLTVVETDTTTADLESSDFSDDETGDGDEHKESQWQIDRPGGDFSSPIVDSGEDASNLTAYTATGLSAFTRYDARVRHRDLGDNWSEWSEVVPLVTVWSGTKDEDPFSGGSIVRVEEFGASEVIVVRRFTSDGNLTNETSELQTLKKLLGIGGGGGGGEVSLGNASAGGGGGEGGRMEEEDVPIAASVVAPVRIGEAGQVGNAGGDTSLWADEDGAALAPNTDSKSDAYTAWGGGEGGAAAEDAGGSGGSGGGGGTGGTRSNSGQAGGSGTDGQGTAGGHGSGLGGGIVCMRGAGGGGGSPEGAGSDGKIQPLDGVTQGGVGGPGAYLDDWGLYTGGGGQGGAAQKKPDVSSSCSNGGGEFETAGDAGGGYGAGGGGSAGNTGGSSGSAGVFSVRYTVAAVPAEPDEGSSVAELSPIGDADRRLYLGTGAQIAYHSSDHLDQSTPVQALLETRPIAPAGAGGEAVFTNLYLSLRHDDEVLLGITPILDGEVLTAEKVSLTLDAPSSGVDRDLLEIGLRSRDSSRAFGLRGTWFQALIEFRSPVPGARIEVEGVELEHEIVTEGVDDRSFTEEGLSLRSVSDSVRWFMGTAAKMLEGDSGVSDDGTAVTARVETREVAPAGIGGEAVFSNLYLTVQRDNSSDLTLHITPILDGTEHETQVLTLSAVSSTAVREVHEIGLSVAYPSAASPEFLYAMRGTWLAVRIETDGALPSGRIIIEGIEVETEIVTEGKEASNAG